MDYTLLKKKAAQSNVSLKRLAVAIDMTESGFFTAIKNDTLSCAKLEKAAQVLGCSICEFFNCDTGNTADDGYKDRYYQLLEKDHQRMDMILRMKFEIDALKEKNKGLPKKKTP